SLLRTRQAIDRRTALVVGAVVFDFAEPDRGARRSPGAFRRREACAHRKRVQGGGGSGHPRARGAARGFVLLSECERPARRWARDCCFGAARQTGARVGGLATARLRSVAALEVRIFLSRRPTVLGALWRRAVGVGGSRRGSLRARWLVFRRRGARLVALRF